MQRFVTLLSALLLAHLLLGAVAPTNLLRRPIRNARS